MRTLGLALAILVVSACTSLGMGPDGPLVGCPQALMEGTLKELAPDTLGLVTDDGTGWSVDWRSYTVKPGPPAELIGEDGGVAARAGDRVAITGGAIGPPGTWTECGGVQLKQPGA